MAQHAQSPDPSHARWVPDGQAHAPLTHGVNPQQSQEDEHAPPYPWQQVENMLEPQAPPLPRWQPVSTPGAAQHSWAEAQMSPAGVQVATHCPPWQAEPAGQSIGVWVMAPVAGSQVSTVQGSPSSMVGLGVSPHAPPLHVRVTQASLAQGGAVQEPQ